MPERVLVDKVAATLIDAWEAAEDAKVNVSHLEIFADMARAVIERYEIKEQDGNE